MYIYKNDSGVELSIEEFIEILEEDLLSELIVIVSYLDSPAFLEEMMFDLSDILDDDNDRIERIFKRFLFKDDE